jgi:hypothetical protein
LVASKAQEELRDAEAQLQAAESIASQFDGDRDTAVASRE